MEKFGMGDVYEPDKAWDDVKVPKKVCVYLDSPQELG